MDEGAPIDWKDIAIASQCGQLHTRLAKLPRERWTETAPHNRTFLHIACTGLNKEAGMMLLKSKLVDVNASSGSKTPLILAIEWRQPTMLELLCAAGTKPQGLDLALLYCGGTARVLIANGARLREVRQDRRRYITPELEAFERGVLRCRMIVVAMLRVKKAGNLWRWDKFLLREVAYAVWATRAQNGWA